MRIVVAAIGVLLATAAAVYAQWGYNYNYSSTAGEGYARGMAAAVRSAGMANVYNAQAAVASEQARTLELDNRLKYTNAFFENRRQNQMARAAARQPALTTEQMYRIAHQLAPKPLTSPELDPLTGDIGWPTVLSDPAFDANRAQLAQLFKLRATDPGGFSGQQLSELRTCVAEFQAALAARIDQFRPQEFIVAKRFLQRLDYAADKSAVASNL